MIGKSTPMAVPLLALSGRRQEFSFASVQTSAKSWENIFRGVRPTTGLTAKADVCDSNRLGAANAV
ncbi:protein of unknown function [Hyphomicrobium sp. MC1]|nr:protein of unknown function [Hyphomicrobium sp. MC1]